MSSTFQENVLRNTQYSSVNNDTTTSDRSNTNNTNSSSISRTVGNRRESMETYSNPLPRLKQIRNGLHFDWRAEMKSTPQFNDISPAMPDFAKTEEHRRKVAGWEPVVRVLADQRLRVALVGRMNCGKSSLFNLICHDPTLPQRVNVVKDFDGITRDSIESHGILGNMHLTIIDTPGMIQGKVVEEAFRTVETADVALFITSPDVELTHEEHDLVRYLAIKRLPTLLVVNKMDLVPVEEEARVLDSYKVLGIGNPLPFSARRRDGLDSLAAAIEPLYHIHAMRKTENDWDLEDMAMNGDEAAMEEIRDRNCTDRFIRVAIVGRANSGKTSLLNRLVGFERNRASSERHTTRDSVEIACMYKGRKLKLIDTAGITSVHSRAERDFINHIHGLSMEQIRFAHVVVVVFDATEGHPNKFDMSVLHKIAEEGRPFLLCANKWDAVMDQSATAEAIDFKIKRQVHEVKYTNAVVVSAETGLNLTLLMDQILQLYDTWNRRARGVELTRFWRKLEKAVIIPHHIARVGRIAQVSIRPPTFLLSLQTKDDEKLLPKSLQSMMKNALVEEFGFQGVPIRLVQRVKDSNPDYI